MTPLTLPTLWSSIVGDPSRDFLVQPERRTSYRELAERIREVVALFDQKGVQPGDRMLIVTTNEAVAIAVFLAGLLDGVVPVMLTPQTADARVASIRDSTAPTLVFSDASRMGEAWAKGAVEIRPFTAAKPSLFGKFRGSPAVASEITLPRSGRAPRLPEALDELAYLLFTSGTTQAPSGVMVSRRNLFADVATISRLFGYGSQSRIFNDMVLAHADGLVQGPLLAVANHCALIRQGGWTLTGQEDWLNAVRRTRATHVITVPTVWAMIDRYASHDDYFDAPECQALFSVAAFLSPDLWSHLERRFKKPVFNHYGLTETVTSALYAGAGPELGAVGTVGLPVDCAARIQAVGGERSGGPGELQLKGDNIFIGYWQNPERTAETFTPDGWMRTGDLAEQDANGSYRIVGRLKSVIMSAALLIRPEEVDEALLRHPAVAQAVTVGMPDPEFEEVPYSAVVLDRPVDEAELTAHCRTFLEALKVPKRIIAVDAIPRGDAGKPQLNAVRAMLTEATSAPVLEAQPGKSTASAVFEVAAEVFRTSPDRLDPSMGPDEIAGWDSFSQINLIFAAERRFGIAIPVAKVAGIRTLADLIGAIEAK
jgi:long-chain acyl-CoA synthetase